MSEGVTEGSFLNLKQAAEYLNVQIATIRNYARKGLIEHRRIGDGPRAHFRFKREWLDAFLSRPPVLDKLDAKIRRVKKVEISDESGFLGLISGGK